MKINKIHLENVKCFHNTTISLEKADTGEPLSVCAFVGTNGSGKSTILKSIVAAFTAVYSEYGGEKLDDDAIATGENTLKVQLELQLNTYEKEAIKQRDTEFKVEYRHTNSLISKPEATGLFLPDELFKQIKMESEEKQNQMLNQYIDSLFLLGGGDNIGLIMYYDPFRFVSHNNPAGPNLMIEENAKLHALSSNLGTDGENLNRDLELKQWLVNIDYIRLKDPTDRNIKIYEHIIKAFDLMMHPLKFESINQKGDLMFKNEDDGTLISIDMLSDGFKSIFSIVLDIIKRLALAEDAPEEEFYNKEAVILIDEIDCHIHPKWQKKLIPAFRELFPNCQFIITTHSPYILDGLQEYEIKKVGNKNII